MKFLEELEIKNNWDVQEAAAIKKMLWIYATYVEGMDEDGNKIGE